MARFLHTIIDAQYGRPFIIVRDQGKKTRAHGVEAIKVLLDVFTLCYYLNYSLKLR